jgi:hypothetical protein
MVRKDYYSNGFDTSLLFADDWQEQVINQLAEEKKEQELKKLKAKQQRENSKEQKAKMKAEIQKILAKEQLKYIKFK